MTWLIDALGGGALTALAAAACLPAIHLLYAVLLRTGLARTVRD